MPFSFDGSRQKSAGADQGELRATQPNTLQNDVGLMARVITAERIGDLVEHAPGWALVGLTVPQERLRADARREVAEHVSNALYRPMDVEEEQLRLPL